MVVAAWDHEQAATTTQGRDRAWPSPVLGLERCGRSSTGGHAMALFPCDVKSHRYPGAQQTMYPALVNGAQQYRRKLRLCPGHFEIAQTLLETRCHNAQMSWDEPALTGCYGCHADVTDSPWQFFVTVYAKGQEREDYWAAVCETCAMGVAEDWQLPPEAT
jgi:hypothetical protein